MSQVTIYNHVSNIYKKQDTTLLAVLLCIKKGTWGYQFENLKNITEEYRAIDDAKKKAEYKKTNFPGFTPSGIFRKRLDNELIKHSGIVHTDVDGLNEEQFAQVKENLKGIENLLIAYFISPSANGFKIFFKVNENEFTQRENYEAAVIFLMVKLQIPKENFDFSCSNVSRLCFMAYDPDCYINPKLKANGIDNDLESLDTGKLLEKKSNSSENKPDQIATKEQLPTAFDNPYLAAGKLDFKHKDDRQNFGKLYNICIKKNGAFEKGSRHTFIQKLIAATNHFGMSPQAVKEYAVLFFKDHPVINIPNDLFDIEKELIPIIDDTYNRYKNEFATWEEDILAELETPCLPNSVYQNLPWFLNSACAKFDRPRERDVFFLSALGILSTTFPRVQGLYDSKWHGMNLFFFISAPASAGKGTLHWSRKLGNKIAKKLKAEYEEEFEIYQQQLQMYEAAKGKENRGEKPLKPIKKKFFIPGNSSTPSIINCISNNFHFGIIFETEADTLVNILNTEFGNFSDIIRKAFHHEPIQMMRRTNDEDLEVEKPYLSMVLSGTPSQVTSLLSSVENGFFSRFLFYDFPNNAEWKDVFAHQSQPLEEYFDLLAFKVKQVSEPYFQPILEDYSNRISFEFTKEQQEIFNNLFKGKLTQLQHIYGDDFIASIKRLAVCFFRVAMILSTLRNIEAKDEDLQALHDEHYIYCSDLDFEITGQIIDCLLLHTVKIFRQVKKLSQNKFGKNIKGTFWEKLPVEFDRKTAMDIASLIGIKEKTAETYLSDFVKANSIIKPQHNHYQKI